MSNNLEKDREITIEVSEEYAEALNTVASWYGLSKSDFLTGMLNGTLDNVPMVKTPTLKEITEVHMVIERDKKRLIKSIRESCKEVEELTAAMEEGDS